MSSVSDSDIIITLFKAVYQKCFGQLLEKVPSESEFKYLSNNIEEKTGLIIGWKSLKNYALFVLGKSDRTINPSSATLDTLSRYVLEAPAITEIHRKNENNSFIFWHNYRIQYLQKHVKIQSRIKYSFIKYLLIPAVVLALVAVVFIYRINKSVGVEEIFQETGSDYLFKRGWFLLAENDFYWSRRNEKSNLLTLFTLKGDSWPTKDDSPHIQNLLYRKSFKDNFSTEVHFSDFRPYENWQQAGIILMEDTLYTGKYIRISLGYNNYFGGIKQPGEIYIQVVASNGNDSPNLEEVVHYPVFNENNEFSRNIIDTNLKYSALKIEKKGDNYRFLYSASPLDNFSYREIGNYNFEMESKYVGLFALKGFVDSSAVIPVSILYFKSNSLSKK